MLKIGNGESQSFEQQQNGLINENYICSFDQCDFNDNPIVNNCKFFNIMKKYGQLSRFQQEN